MTSVGGFPNIAAYREEELKTLLAEFADLPPELLRLASDGYEFHDPSLEREEGILTSLTLRRALDNFSAFDADARERFMAIITSFTVPECRDAPPDTLADFTIPHALVLKALAYHPFDLEALADFAAQLHSYSARAMLNATTLVEIDYGSNTDVREVSGLYEDAAAGTLAQSGNARNDGANQSFRTSCVAASILIYRGEMDPIFALKVRESGFDAPLPDSVWTAEQRRILAESKLWRERAYKRPFYRVSETLLNDGGIVDILAGLYSAGAIPRADYAIILRKLDYWADVYCNPCLGTLRERVGERLRVLPPDDSSFLGDAAHYLGIEAKPADIPALDLITLLAPYERDILAHLRKRGFPRENGLDLAEIFDPAQFHTLGEPTAEAFTAFNTGDDFAGTASRPVAGNEELLAELLAGGQDVILSYNAHATLLGDVREKDGKIWVYQADPDDGTGRWLDPFSIRGGDFHYPLRECR